MDSEEEDGDVLNLDAGPESGDDFSDDSSQPAPCQADNLIAVPKIEVTTKNQPTNLHKRKWNNVRPSHMRRQQVGQGFPSQNFEMNRGRLHPNAHPILQSQPAMSPWLPGLEPRSLADLPQRPSLQGPVPVNPLLAFPPRPTNQASYVQQELAARNCLAASLANRLQETAQIDAMRRNQATKMFPVNQPLERRQELPKTGNMLDPRPLINVQRSATVPLLAYPPGQNIGNSQDLVPRELTRLALLRPFEVNQEETLKKVLATVAPMQRNYNSNTPDWIGFPARTSSSQHMPMQRAQPQFSQPQFSQPQPGQLQLGQLQFGQLQKSQTEHTQLHRTNFLNDQPTISNRSIDYTANLLNEMETEAKRLSWELVNSATSLINGQVYSEQEFLNRQQQTQQAVPALVEHQISTVLPTPPRSASSQPGLQIVPAPPIPAPPQSAEVNLLKTETPELMQRSIFSQPETGNTGVNPQCQSQSQSLTAGPSRCQHSKIERSSSCHCQSRAGCDQSESQQSQCPHSNCSQKVKRSTAQCGLPTCGDCNISQSSGPCSKRVKHHHGPPSSDSSNSDSSSVDTSAKVRTKKSKISREQEDRERELEKIEFDRRQAARLVSSLRWHEMNSKRSLHRPHYDRPGSPEPRQESDSYKSRSRDRYYRYDRRDRESRSERHRSEYYLRHMHHHSENNRETSERCSADRVTETDLDPAEIALLKHYRERKRLLGEGASATSTDIGSRQESPVVPATIEQELGVADTRGSSGPTVPVTINKDSGAADLETCASKETYVTTEQEPMGADFGTSPASEVPTKGPTMLVNTNQERAAADFKTCTASEEQAPGTSNVKTCAASDEPVVLVQIKREPGVSNLETYTVSEGPTQGSVMLVEVKQEPGADEIKICAATKGPTTATSIQENTGFQTDEQISFAALLEKQRLLQLEMERMTQVLLNIKQEGKRRQQDP